MNVILEVNSNYIMETLTYLPKVKLSLYSRWRHT